ncbi:hypothetical protein BST86_13940 [Nonlabens agnitus]|uniref:Transglutaminase-like domain-containing protein n=2 Tax=Nonlabens agnitus TaxID=870484 RepID=A0A2S9WXB3_9FLAO|nr:hypothetical protein BST86_13940 [Nonlabens agnitus]
MTRNEVNALLRREIIQDGSLYDALIPVTDCQVFAQGSGNPKRILKEMATYASKYAHQIEKVARKLQQQSLERTCEAFYQFQRDYFQYDVDGKAQRLRTPACAWANRREGMDCKSFAIMSAALCASIGIRSKMRQIKMVETGDRISHVYVIVPIDQKTGSLNSGYYVIDGSALENREAPHYWNNDMEILPFYGMNAALAGMNCGCKESNNNALELTSNEYHRLQNFIQEKVDNGACPEMMQKAAETCWNKLTNNITPKVIATDTCITVDGMAFPYNYIGDQHQGMNLDPFTMSLIAGSLGGGGGAEGGGTGGILGGAGGSFDLSQLTGALDGIVGIFDSGTGACGIRFENERKKGHPFFHDKRVHLKWRDAEFVLAHFGDSLLKHGWRTNHCPSSSAQGDFKRAEDAFWTVLAKFLDDVIAGKTQLPESLANDDDLVIRDYILQFVDKLPQNNNTGNAYVDQNGNLGGFDNPYNGYDGGGVENGGSWSGNPYNNYNPNNPNNIPPKTAGIGGKEVLIGIGLLAAVGAGAYYFKNNSKPTGKSK